MSENIQQLLKSPLTITKASALKSPVRTRHSVRGTRLEGACGLSPQRDKVIMPRAFLITNRRYRPSFIPGAHDHIQRCHMTSQPEDTGSPEKENRLSEPDRPDDPVSPLPLNLTGYHLTGKFAMSPLPLLASLAVDQARYDLSYLTPEKAPLNLSFIPPQCSLGGHMQHSPDSVGGNMQHSPDSLNSPEGSPCSLGGHLHSPESSPCPLGGRIHSPGGSPCSLGSHLHSPEGSPCSLGGHLHSPEGSPCSLGSHLHSPDDSPRDLSRLGCANLSELVERAWSELCPQDTHVCPECGKRYSTSSNLARHRQTHRSVTDKKARKCPHCEKVYVSMPAYSMHVRTHNQGCECPYCGKRFSRPWLLQGHIRTHTGEKPFKCPQCSKAFADKSNLRAHIQTHSSEKPYVCGRCGKAFALKSYLYKHEESSCMRGLRQPRHRAEIDMQA